MIETQTKTATTFRASIGGYSLTIHQKDDNGDIVKSAIVEFVFSGKRGSYGILRSDSKSWKDAELILGKGKLNALLIAHPQCIKFNQNPNQEEGELAFPLQPICFALDSDWKRYEGGFANEQSAKIEVLEAELKESQSKGGGGKALQNKVDALTAKSEKRDSEFAELETENKTKVDGLETHILEMESAKDAEIKALQEKLAALEKQEVEPKK